MKVTLASGNAHKLREIAAIMPSWEIAAPPADWVAPPETGETYEENALIKARSLAVHLNAPVIADDSGIEMYALDGAPGVRSARFAGEYATDEENLAKLLDAARATEDGLRGARYVCVAVFVDPAGTTTTAEGTVDGCLITERRGTGGFGYDPIFVASGQPEGLERTMAEFSPQEKDAISHRARALRALAANLDQMGSAQA